MQFLVLVDNVPYQLCQPLPPAFCSLEIRYKNNMFTGVPKEQSPAINQWLIDLINRCTNDYILINGAYVLRSDIIERISNECEQ